MEETKEKGNNGLGQAGCQVSRWRELLREITELKNQTGTGRENSKLKKQENHPQMGGSEGRQVFSLHEPRG